MTSTSAARRLLAALLLVPALAAFSPLRGQTDASEPPVLEPLVTTATRTPAAPQTIGTAIDAISFNDLARRQISSLNEALGGIAGAPHFSSGATGAVSSMFLRGSNSNQTLFLVDGLRLNDPNTDYQMFLGGAGVTACDSLEVARGPQSTLYGGEAVGGVISLSARRGQGTPTESWSVGGGSFGTVQGALAAQGERGPWAYNFSTRAGRTDNERENNSFDSATTALRLDRKVSERLALGGTLRWFHGVYADPGDRYTDDPNNEEREDNVLGTLFADVKVSDAWSAHLMLGGQDRRFVSNNPEPNPPYESPAQRTVVTNRRAVFDGQTTLTGFERHRITAGVTAEANYTRNNGFGDINKKQGLWAVFAQDEYSPVENVYLTGGVRNDDYDTFGRATTGRVTAAWLTAHRRVKLRASYGTAFRSPSFLDLYGRSPFYVGSLYATPSRLLKTEKAHGWDTGVDFYLPENRGTLSATWFDTRVRDLIDYDFSVFPGTVINVNRARTRGLELTAKASVSTRTEARFSYGYLEATDLGSNTRLLRRPRHSFSADLWRAFGEKFSAGAGIAFVADRRDVDAKTFATITAEDYTVARVYADYKVTEALHLNARVENLLNEKYEEVNGYPALGFGAYGSVTYKF